METRIKKLSQQNQHLQKIRNSMGGLHLHRGRVCEPKAPPSPPSETSSVPKTSRAPIPIPFGSGHAAIRSLKRSDTEVFKVPAKSPSPPPETQWRDRTRQRERLNLDFSRIETHLLLTPEFIDDVNAMLDRFEFWSALEIVDIALAFKKDCDNRGRIVEFVDLGNRKWGIRFLNPLNPERRDSGMLCPFRSSDNPENLCQQPGSKECSNKAYVEERAADLRRFRNQQMMPPPPLQPRSDKRTAPPRPPQAAGLQATPVITSRTANTSRPVNDPRPRPSSMSEEGMRPEHNENVELSGLKMWTQMEQVKSFMSQFKTQAGDKQGAPPEGREMVRQFLQNLKLTQTPSERLETAGDSKISEHSNVPKSLKLPEQPIPPKRLKFPEQPVSPEQPGTPEQSTASVPPTVLEPSSTPEPPNTPEQPEASEQSNTSEQSVRHPDGSASSNASLGKLNHKEKIPTGPHSLRREDVFFTSGVNSRGVHPFGTWTGDAHEKPREQYYATANTIVEESSDENVGSAARLAQELSIDCAIQSAISSNKPRLSFRPQYLKNADAYYEMQAERIGPAEELRIRRRRAETPTMPPDEKAMEFFRTSPGLRPLDETQPPITESLQGKLKSPQLRDSMDIDDGIPVWDPEDEDGAPLTRQGSQDPTEEEICAYQEHIKAFLRKHSSQQTERRATPTVEPFLKSLPFECTAEEAERNARRIKYELHRHLKPALERPIHRDTRRGDEHGGRRPRGLEPRDRDNDKDLLDTLILSLIK